MDLKNPKIIQAKGLLFLLMGVIAALLLLARTPELSSALLLAICIWAFCRFYYFAFYVLENYVDPSFRYRGLVHLINSLWKKQRKQESQDQV